MACGMIAMMNAGVTVDTYDAYEIDKYAIKTSQHNFPMIKQHGNVFGADFTQYEGVDYVVGGSPCTFWSIAQKNNRETEASGFGWELFQQYVRAIKEANPKFFIYENNKSMSKQIRACIDTTFGFEAIGINSALLSAQNRQRLYWVGKRNEDGTYSKVDVAQPKDRGILLKDILDNNDLVDMDKAYCLKHQAGNVRDHIKKHHTNVAFIPVNTTDEGKAQCIRATYYKDGQRNLIGNTIDRKTGVAEPVCVASRGRYLKNFSGETEQHFEVRGNKTNALTTVQKDNNVAVPVATPNQVWALPRPNGELSTSQAFRVYSIDGKSVVINAGGGGAGGKTGLYAIPIEFDGNKPIKAISVSDNKTYTVYEVKNGMITYKDKQYPIKLPDGYYIIRKLSVSECKRLQTVPEWYDFSVVSDTQAYKMLGNGWTCDVITHLIKATLKQYKSKIL